MAGSLYSVWMSARSLKEIPGIEFVVDGRGRRKSVVIDLGRHGALWEDLFDADVAQQRRNEPREPLSKVKKLVQSAPEAADPWPTTSLASPVPRGRSFRRWTAWSRCGSSPWSTCSLEEPRPAGCAKLEGAADLWRVRVGDYRIIYTVDDRARTVDVSVVRHRRDAYRP